MPDCVGGEKHGENGGQGATAVEIGDWQKIEQGQDSRRSGKIGGTAVSVADYEYRDSDGRPCKTHGGFAERRDSCEIVFEGYTRNFRATQLQSGPEYGGGYGVAKLVDESCGEDCGESAAVPKHEGEGQKKQLGYPRNNEPSHRSP